MPDGGHHDTHIKRELVGAALLEELPSRNMQDPLQS